MQSFFRKIFDKTFFRFVLVGCINTLFGAAIMFVAYNVLDCSYWVSSAANYFFGSILSFFLNKYFTFRNKQHSIRQVIRFVINILCCYLIAYGIAKPVAASLLSNSSTSVQENGAMLVGVVLFVILNYFGQRFFAFREKEN